MLIYIHIDINQMEKIQCLVKAKTTVNSFLNRNAHAQIVLKVYLCYNISLQGGVSVV